MKITEEGKKRQNVRFMKLLLVEVVVGILFLVGAVAGTLAMVNFFGATTRELRIAFVTWSIFCGLVAIKGFAVMRTFPRRRYGWTGVVVAAFLIFLPNDPLFHLIGIKETWYLSAKLLSIFSGVVAGFVLGHLTRERFHAEADRLAELDRLEQIRRRVSELRGRQEGIRVEISNLSDEYGQLTNGQGAYRTLPLEALGCGSSHST